MRRKIALFIIALFVLSSGCAYYNTFFNALKFYDQAAELRKEREKNEIVELSPEEEQNARSSGTSTKAGRSEPSQKEMQAYQNAIERSARVLEMYPDSKWVDDALILLAKCFYYRRDYKRGQRKCEELMQNYPESEFVPEALLLKAKINIGLEEYDTAVEELRQLGRNKDVPKDIQETARFELGGMYYKLRMYDLAAENYESVVRSAEDELISAMAMYRLGDCYLQLKMYDKAPPYFKRAVKAAPNEDFLAQATIRLGQSLSLSGDYEEATKIFRNHLAKEYDEKRIPRVKLELAQNLRFQGNLQDALTWYENIIEEHKRTDASARAYYALGQIEEEINGDYRRAQINYDMVRGEFQQSLVAPNAQLRSDNIKTLLDLSNEIAKLEGREVEADSLAGDDNADSERVQKNDAPINLSLDGIWVNYTGRDRPPPISLADLTEEDLQRKAKMDQILAEKIAQGDSTAIEQNTLQTAQLDSAALAKMHAEEEANKIYRLSERYLALGEVFYFNFDRPDTAITCYQYVVDQHVDSSLTARALYSLAYIYRQSLQDTALANEVLTEIVDLFPNTEHAEGARKILNMPLKSDQVDSAKVLFKRGEDALFRQSDVDRALQIWEQIVEEFPNSPYAAKAAYSRAWHLERSLFALDQAKAEYELILDTFPETEFAEKVKAKLDDMEKSIKAEAARKQAIQDSLAAIALNDSLAIADSATVSVPDSLLTKIQPESTTVTATDSLPQGRTVREPDAQTVEEQKDERSTRAERRAAARRRKDSDAVDDNNPKKIEK